MSVLVAVTGSDSDPPTADAGLDAIYSLDAVIFLDGSGQDPEGDPLTYRWEMISGPVAVAISDTMAPQTSFTALRDGQYTFRLTVSDSLLSATDDVTILVTPADNIRPVSVAGDDQLVSLGSVVVLDGSRSSDPDSLGTLSFLWRVGDTPGDPVVLADEMTANPSFTPAQVGTYVFGLTVDDGVATSIQDIARWSSGSSSGAVA